MERELADSLDDLILGRGVARGRHALRSPGAARAGRDSKSGWPPTASLRRRSPRSPSSRARRSPPSTSTATPPTSATCGGRSSRRAAAASSSPPSAGAPTTRSGPIQLSPSSPERVWANPALKERHDVDTVVRGEPVSAEPLIETFPVGPLAVQLHRSSPTRSRAKRSSSIRATSPSASCAPSRPRSSRRSRSLHTHAHLDHITGSRAVKEATGAPIRLHPADRPLYDALPEQAAFFGLRAEAPLPPDTPLSDGERIRFGPYVLRADPHAGPHARLDLLPARGRPPDALLRRHALPPLDRPHRSLGRRHGRDPRVDPGEALRPAGRRARRLRPRARNDDRRGEAPEPFRGGFDPPRYNRRP